MAVFAFSAKSINEIFTRTMLPKMLVEANVLITHLTQYATFALGKAFVESEILLTPAAFQVGGN